MNKVFFYFVLPGLIPAVFLTGGVESPLRLIYFPAILLLTRFFDPNSLLLSSLTFCALYAILPLIVGDEYPFYAVGENVPAFLVMALASGYLSGVIKGEEDSVRKTSDTYHGLTNALNLNITNLQSQIDSMMERYERLKELDVNKTHFLSSISHEIRSPLSSIRSFSEILLNYSDIDDDTRKEFLGIINEESERLTQLTNEILDVVRLDSGRTQWHMDNVDVGEVIQTGVKTILPLAKNKGLLMETNLPGNLTLVKGDRNRLLQVMLNLLSNAVKFTSRGGITAGAEEMPEEIRVFVRDTGEGIYPEEKEKVFEEFYRIGDELAGRAKGSGLGLSICKKIIEGHRGRIWVESQLGKGSTFYFTLYKKSIAAREDAMATRGVDLVGGQIMILEDDTAMRRILRENLEAMGYRTLGANSTRTAVELARLRHPDAIITGYLEGEEQFSEIRTLSSVLGIPVYMVSVINDEKSGPQVAVNGYISKPFDKDQIEKAIRAVLNRDSGRITIISNKPDEARDLQLFMGSKGYETSIVPDADSVGSTRPVHLIVVGSFPKDDLYAVLTTLRTSGSTVYIPIVLTLNILVRDMRCIGLGTTQYGGGLEKMVEMLREKG